MNSTNKLIILLGLAVLLFALTACKSDRETIRSETDRAYHVECIDGIEYWVRTYGYRGVMAVRVDPETMTYVRCGE